MTTAKEKIQISSFTLHEILLFCQKARCQSKLAFHTFTFPELPPWHLILQISPPLLTFNATPAEVTEHSEWKINQTGAPDADRINLWHLPPWQLYLSTQPLCALVLDFRLLQPAWQKRWRVTSLAPHFQNICTALALEFLHSICLTGRGQS